MACETVGMPLITPVAGSMASPAGRPGVIDQVGVPVPPIRASAPVVSELPTVPVTADCGTLIPVTPIEIVFVAVTPFESVAVIV